MELAALETKAHRFLMYGRVSVLHQCPQAITLLLRAPMFVLNDISTALANVRLDYVWDALRFKAPSNGQRFFHLSQDEADADVSHRNKRMRHARHQSMRLHGILGHHACAHSAMYLARTLTLTPQAASQFDTLQLDHPESVKLSKIIQKCTQT
jgi:hypothetical protein